MRRYAGFVSISALGLVMGCGDNTNQTTENPTSAPSTTSMMSSSSEGSGSGTSTAQPTTDAPTSSIGESMTSEPSTGTSTGTTSPVTMTDGSTSTSTTEGTTTSTTDGSSSSGSSGMMSSDGSSSSSTTGMMTSMSSSTASASTMDMPCDEIKVTLKPIVPNMQLVIDKSGSMLTLWDHDANPNTATVTRWFSLYAVVDKILTSFNAKLNFGMNLYPSKSANGNYNSGACPVNANVEVPVAPMNKAAIQAALPAQMNMSIKGGTPNAAGLTAAYNHLKGLDPLIPKLAINITDGAANCSSNAMNASELFEVYDANLPTVVGNAFTMDSIKTYVIGIATVNMVTPNQQDGNPNGINPFDKLNELATLGGTAKPGPEKFYNADNQIELADALNAIVADAFSCTIELTSEPAFPDKTKVKVGGVTLMKINDCATENGWKYKDPAPPYEAIEICGTACESLKMTGSAQVEYFCDAG